MSAKMTEPVRANRALVVYCLYVAGGVTERVHTEDLALKCWELFPDSFSWTKYPKYPDKDIVRVALTDARKDKYGALVSGRVEGKASGVGHGEPEGWLLTDKGLGWIKDNLSLFGDDPAKHERKAHRQVLLRRVKKLTTSDLYRRFEESSTSFSPSIGELAAFLLCRVDANEAVWERRLAEIRRLGIDAGEDAIGRFAAACSDLYHRER
jgi:hypothetical protein